MKTLCLSIFISSFAALAAIYPLTDLKLENSSKLSPLKEMINSAKIVGIGESAHGSKNYIKARTLITKYLTQNLNFKNIILEAGYLKVKKLRDQLDRCMTEIPATQDFHKAIKELHPLEHNVEMLELFQYLCQHTYKTKQKIHFAGLDIWTLPWEERDIFKKLVEVLENEELSKAYDIAYKHCWVWKANSWKEASKQEDFKYVAQNWRINPNHHIPCLGTLENAKNLLIQNQDSYIEQSSKTIFNAALKAVRNQIVFQQYRNLYVFDRSKALNLRDAQQALYTQEFINKHPGKTIVLAHNVHIAKNQFQVLPQYPQQWDNVRSLGERLVAIYGRDYFALALTGYDIANSNQKYPTPNREDSLDRYLSSYGELLLLSTDVSDINLHDKWWMHWEYFVNGGYLVPADQYDAIFFIKHSPAATPLSSDGTAL